MRVISSAFCLFALIIQGSLLMTLSANAFEVTVTKSPQNIPYWLVQSDVLPLVTLDFSIQAGSVYDPEGKEGLAYLHSALLDEGAGELDFSAFQEALDRSQVKLSFDSSQDYFQGRVKTLKDQIDDAIHLTSLALNQPRFDEDAIERVKQQIISSLNSRQFDAQSIAGKAWFEAAFKGHPYARYHQGNTETIPLITQEDLINFHKKAVTRQNLYISIVGDVSEAEAGDMVDRIFAQLPQSSSFKEIKAVKPRAFGHQHISLDVPQTVIRFGGEGVLRDDEDFMPAFVMNHILGGGSFTSWLYNEVREERGLAYSVYSFLYPLEKSALFYGGAATEQERAQITLDVIKEQIEKMVTQGVDEDMLKAAKTYLIGSYPLRFDTSTNIARQLTGLQSIGFTPDYITQRETLIEAVTQEDIQRVAKRLFSEDTLSIISVGR